MIRVLIADDHPIVREGLERILGECADMEVVAQAADGDELLELLQVKACDVVLMDLSMPGPGAFRLLSRIGDERPNVRVLILSVQPEEMYAVRALRSGASGYLTKDRSPDELALAVRKVHQGGRYVSESLAEHLAFTLNEQVGQPAHESLSNRELEVLCRLGEGKIIKEIATELNVSPKTISTYRARLLAKLELETTADLIRYAIHNDLVS